MIKFFENDFKIKIILDYKLKDDDIQIVNSLFDKKSIVEWEIIFNRIYSVNFKFFNLLYKYIILNQKNIKIITHKYRLHRYFNRLGLKNQFISLIPDLVKNSFDIDIILIGGSADSTPKIINILSNININNLSVIIVQHIDSKKENHFDKTLQKAIQKTVLFAENGMSIEKSKVYLAPKNKHLKISDDGYFLLDDSAKYNAARPSISVSYRSFSQYYKNKLLVVQECGYEVDGIDSLSYVKNNKSMIIIQDDIECEAKSMVINALVLNIYDYKLSQQDIIEFINFVTKSFNNEEWINYLLVEIRNRYSYDFTMYKSDLIKRRLEVFRLKHSIPSLEKTIEVILYNKSAFKGFFLELSINVTELFRNPRSFIKIEKLLSEQYTEGVHLKVWSAGCSSGEEVYSLAMLLDEFGYLDKSIIYATDFNSVVIDEAKNGIYPLKYYNIAKENIKELNLNMDLDKYVIKYDDFIKINDKIHQKTHFFTHNLAVDGSFNEFDIIICKNVIIYFDDILLEIVFKLIYDSLKVGGHLVLGESESIYHGFLDKFEQCSKECKIYKKVV